MTQAELTVTFLDTETSVFGEFEQAVAMIVRELGNTRKKIILTRYINGHKRGMGSITPDKDVIYAPLIRGALLAQESLREVKVSSDEQAIRLTLI